MPIDVRGALLRGAVPLQSGSLINPAVFSWVVLPLLIFAARICDVTIGTIRIIAIGRGKKYIAPLLGFFEVLIWLVAIRQIMQDLTNFLYYGAFAAGFAAGTFVGMYIEEKLAMGLLLIRVITKMDASHLIDFLENAGYGVTSVDARGAKRKVNVIYTIIKRSDLKEVVALINRFNPKAFYSIEDIRSVKEGVFPGAKPFYQRGWVDLLRMRRKAK